MVEQERQITPTADDYHQAAVSKANARKQGSILQLTDCLIAAVAVRLGLTLVTGNTEDFQAIHRTGIALVIESWREDGRSGKGFAEDSLCPTDPKQAPLRAINLK